MKNLKRVITLLVISLFSLNSIAQSDVTGTYILGKKNTMVKIEQRDDAYFGNIISSDNPKAIIGKLIVKELKKQDGSWKGKIYSQKRKEWYDAEFIPKENALDVTIEVGFFSKTMEWRKVSL